MHSLSPLSYLDSKSFVLPAFLIPQSIVIGSPVNVGWDEEVNQEFRRRVEEVSEGFPGGNHFRVIRWLGVTPPLQEYTRVLLHVFTYAWSRAYASAAYLRVADVEEKVTVNLIASNYRLAPPSGETITRLELLGSLLEARLLKSLRGEYKGFLKTDAEFLWRDSSVALAWINQRPKRGWSVCCQPSGGDYCCRWSVVLGHHRRRPC